MGNWQEFGEPGRRDMIIDPATGEMIPKEKLEPLAKERLVRALQIARMICVVTGNEKGVQQMIEAERLVREAMNMPPSLEDPEELDEEHEP